MKKFFSISLITLFIVLNIIPLNAMNNKKTITNVQKLVRTVTDSISINKTDYITSKLPIFPKYSKTQNRMINNEIMVFVNKHMDIFKKEFANRYNNPDPQNHPYMQDISYQICSITNDWVSLKLFVYEYTGGAHGNTTVYNINYDVKRLKNIKFDEFFPAMNPTVLARLTTKDCVKQNISLFKKPIPAEKNLFKIWNISEDKGLVITFPQYEVAPYSDGIIEVYISARTVERFNRPEYSQPKQNKPMKKTNPIKTQKFG